MAKRRVPRYQQEPDKQPAVDRDIVGQFIDAAVQDRALAIRLLRQHPELKKSRWRHDETPLHFLAVEGYADAVRFLADCGFDVNATNQFGDAALIDVATSSDVEIAGILLAHGADPDARSVTRDNVLHCAVGAGNVRLVEMLLEAGANADYVTDLGETVFDALPNKFDRRKKILEVLERFGFRPPETANAE